MSFYSHLVKSSVIFFFFLPPVDIAHLPHVSLYVIKSLEEYVSGRRMNRKPPNICKTIFSFVFLLCSRLFPNLHREKLPSKIS